MATTALDQPHAHAAHAEKTSDDEYVLKFSEGESVLDGLDTDKRTVFVDKLVLPRTLKVLERGALIAAANWPLVVVQFIAEATLKLS